MRWLRLVRVHQWAKNGLLLLPAVAAHVLPSASGVVVLGSAVISFSLLASALYILNDLVDREHDRLHPTKRHRPLAAGTVGTGTALGLMTVLAVASLGLALTLPVAFLEAWIAYLVLTTSYSFLLKRVVLLDVVILAALYTVRVVAGAAALTIPLSRWFLAFSVFLFLSLALLKRLVELVGVADGGVVGVVAGGVGEVGEAPEPMEPAAAVAGAVAGGSAAVGEPARAGERAAQGEGEVPGEAGAAGAQVTPGGILAGRGWRAADLPLLRSLGVGSGVAAALVYCLYITDEPARQLYRRYDLLWVGLPIFLYWIARVWILANRGEVHDDPVVFALRDPVSYVVLVLLVLLVMVAA